jgi:hypothetical protein
MISDFSVLRKTTLFLVLTLSICRTNVRAQEREDASAAGGIQLQRSSQISMEKERLTISRDRVIVEYEFLNETDREIATEVVFPVPPYGAETDPHAERRDFRDFRVWAEGMPIAYKMDIAAGLDKADYTKLLHTLGVTIETFGDLRPVPGQGDQPTEILRLADPDRQRLRDSGLIDVDNYPLWSVVKTYHWRQRFPAHQILRMRSEYTPVVGLAALHYWEVKGALKNACVSAALHERLNFLANDSWHANGSRGDYATFGVTQIEYLLTTANTWKTPIKNFGLTVEKPKDRKDRDHLLRNFVSFCWDSNLGRPDPKRHGVTVLNFHPEKELTVYFIEDAGF